MGDPVEIGDDRTWSDQRSRFDVQRATCPVALEDGRWVLLGHAEVVKAATDPETFSSRVTDRLALPNALDGAEHAAYRAVVDRYFTDDLVAGEEEQCRKHASAIVDALPRDVTVKTIGSIGIPYAVRSQTSWLGWPSELEDQLVAWIADNHEATRSGDRERMAAVADRFDRMILALLDSRRDKPATDVTARLMNETVEGRRLTDDEVVSILRNWTAGDLGSLATSVGVLVHFLATHTQVQESLREMVRDADRHGVEAAIEEILRIDDPFVANRRLTTQSTDIGGVEVPRGARVLLNWTAANRDPLVFGDPDHYDPVGNAEANLVFGIGPHVCPGRSLTLMELRVMLGELLGRTNWIEPAPGRPAVREMPPVGGWARVPVVLR